MLAVTCRTARIVAVPGAMIKSGGDNCHGPIRASATVGSTSQTFTEASAVAGNVWGTFGFDFVADSSSMTLTINGVDLPAGNAYIGLDNVSVAPGVVGAVPEPETHALFLAGLGALGFVARKRARRLQSQSPATLAGEG